MKIISTGVICLIILAYIINLSGCQAIAISGDKKYKVALSNVILKATDEINTDGKVKDATVTKLESLLEQYEEDYGNRGSFLRASTALDLIKQAGEKPDQAFQILQNAKQSMFESQEMLKTEVKD